jgi:hypothetical protein
VGRQIHARGGRPVLAASALLLAAGLAILAAAPTLLVFVTGWVVIGCGMSAGLYDAAFSTLGRLYGQAARHHITTLTLFGGFASTACWPLSAYLLAHLGWRGTCLAYAAIHLGVCLPIYLMLIRDAAGADHAAAPSRADADGRGRGGGAAGGPRDQHGRRIYLLLAAAIMLGGMAATVVSVHLLALLQARGLTLAAAVALGACIGPSQVGARFIEMLIARFHHPIWTKIVSVSLVALGLLLLWIKIPIVALALVCYGAGMGLESIARATLPLALFGPAHYAPIMGRLARPSLIAQALAPSLAALLSAALGLEAMLGILVLVTLANVALTMGLFAMTRRAR